MAGRCRRRRRGCWFRRSRDPCLVLWCVLQALAPYFELTQAVRTGDLAQFHAVADRHAQVFAADQTSRLIVRLRHNVIRAGLRRISIAYSRISLKDVAAKLGGWSRARCSGLHRPARHSTPAFRPQVWEPRTTPS